jgi:hypothetical protein
MSTWTSISNGAVAVGGIPSSATVTALRDNPVAIAGAASGAPVVFAGWHPYDKVTIGDGNDGLIYDSAVNGTVADIVTPDFVDGFEYRLYCDGIRHNSGSSRNITIQAFRETLATYTTAYSSASTYSTANSLQVDAEFVMPRLLQGRCILRAIVGSTSVLDANQGNIFSTSDNKILRARIVFSAGSINVGKVYLFRRREYLTSP